MKGFSILEEEKKRILSLYKINENEDKNELPKNVVDGLLDVISRDTNFQGYFTNDPYNFYYKYSNTSEGGQIRFHVFTPVFSVRTLGITMFHNGVVFVDPKTKRGFIESFEPPQVSKRDLQQQVIPDDLSLDEVVGYLKNYSTKNTELRKVLNGINKKSSEILSLMNNPSVNQNLRMFYQKLIEVL
jgi:hypothetical protein